MASTALPASLRWLVLAALGAVAAALTLVPAGAEAKEPEASALPTITKVAPAQARIGATVTITGRNFLVGRGRTTVVFKRDGRKPVLVKADIATKRMLKVVVPATLEEQLGTRGDAPVFTKFRLRVIGKRYMARYSPRTITVGPATQPGVDVDACADVRAGGDPDGDLDGDLLANAEELRLRTPLNPCADDTDGDTMTDGWEYFSAKDLNIRAVPYPAKRPFPNPLDPEDSRYDYDGDGLRAIQEFSLWNAYGRPVQTMANREELLYSDGTKTSSGPGPSQLTDRAALQANAAVCVDTVVPPSLGYLGLGYVAPGVSVEDNEKDADGDGLGNWVEANGHLQQTWWKEVYSGELAYPLRNFANADPVDPDVDGDGCLDGLDDQDADDWPNWTESGAHYSTWFDTGAQWLLFGPVNLVGGTKFPAWLGWADSGGSAPFPFASNPFNPCLPDVTSRTCSTYVSVEKWPPFSKVYEDGCRLPLITYRGRTVSVWLWDTAERKPWATPCPPVPAP